jgi:hypothetical protein
VKEEHKATKIRPVCCSVCLCCLVAWPPNHGLSSAAAALSSGARSLARCLALACLPHSFQLGEEDEDSNLVNPALALAEMHFGLAAAGGSTLCLTVPVLPARTAFTTCTYACMNATACGPPQPPPATSGLCTATPPWLLCA